MTPEFGSPRTAIVTGGARRLGAAFARSLAADGWTLLIHYNASHDEAATLAAELGAGTRIVRADLADPAAAAAIVAALGGMPPPALLINSASIFEEDKLDGVDVDRWDRHQAINLRAPALLTQAFAEAVAGQPALIVNILDAKLAQPNPDFFSYTISKMGLAGLTELSARALAARGIRVCAIAPSVTLVSGKQTRANFDAVHRLNALKRGVTADQLVAALRFIIASPTLTGQVIALDAGQRFLGLDRDVQYLNLPELS